MATHFIEESLRVSGGLFQYLQELPMLTHEQEAELLVQVREGSDQARHALIVGTLRKLVWKMKGRLQKGKRAWRLEWEDVVQEVYLFLWEHCTEMLTAWDPCAFLCKQASYALLRYVDQAQSLVAGPGGCAIAAPLVESLDRPLGEGAYHETFADLLEAPASSPSVAVDYEPLYQAVKRLAPGLRRAFIEMYHLEAEYGLEEAEPLQAHARARRCAEARKRLRELLAETYPQYAGGYQRVQVRPVYADVVLNEHQVQRLQQAYQALCARGERVSVPVLKREAHVGLAAAGGYLYRLRQEQCA